MNLSEAPLPDDPGDDYFNEFPSQPDGPAAANVSTDEIAGTLRNIWYAVAAAALNSGAPADRATEIISQLRGASVIYRALGKQGPTLHRSLMHASAVLGDVQGGNIWLADLGLLDNRRIANDVVSVFSKVANTAPAEHPESALGGAISLARKEWSKSRSAALIAAITAGDDPESLIIAHNDVVESPPTAIDGSAAAGENGDVSAIFAEEASRQAGLVLSSGFPSLDMAVTTADGQPRGYVRSGQLVVFVAPSGSGKTSAFSTIVPAGVLDADRQGHLGRTIYCHNEDETSDLFAGFGIAPGRKYARLLDRVVPLKTTSREEFVTHFYREVLWAKRRAEDTGLPTSLFMPPAVFVDYFQALVSPTDKSEVDGTSRTADLLLYGVANCDPVACKTFSGVGFQEFAGEAWPSDLDGYGIAVVVTAQLLLKGTSALLPFNPEKQTDWRNYASADAYDNPAWTPRAGDSPLSKLEDIRGSSKVVQHATLVVGLHRPRSKQNPESGVNAAGYRTLADTRGFFTVLKARFGSRLLVVPVEFNLQRDGGSRAQYFDAAAETALANPATAFPHDDEIFTMTGDPIIPKRPRVSKMKEVRY